MKTSIKSKLITTILATLVLVASLILISHNNKKPDPLPQVTIATYEIVTFSKIQDESFTSYRGAAIRYNELGSYDSISFVSDKQPEKGSATFAPWYDTNGKIAGWVFIKMSK